VSARRQIVPTYNCDRPVVRIATTVVVGLLIVARAAGMNGAPLRTVDAGGRRKEQPVSDSR
jgi:hypothetical protein